MQTPPTPRLTAAEISALLSVAGDANARETLLLDSGEPDEAAMAAFERGMEKLRVMLARRGEVMPPGIDLDKLRAAERMGELRNPEGIQPLLIAGLLEPVRKAEPGEPLGPWRITDKGRAAIRKAEGG